MQGRVGQLRTVSFSHGVLGILGKYRFATVGRGTPRLTVVLAVRLTLVLA
jgi:hypothetical protein